MKRVFSKNTPAVRKIGRIIKFPIDIKEEIITLETGGQETHYSCLMREIEYNKQDIESVEFIDFYSKKFSNELAGQTLENNLCEGCQTSLGFKIDCKQKNLSDWASTMQSLEDRVKVNPGVTERIRDYNNIDHFLTHEQYRVMYQELIAHVASLRQQKWDNTI